MNPIRRRTYSKPRELIADLGAVLADRREIGAMMRGESLNPAFRERLMLTVTAVNRCPYCSYAHARQALVAGLSAAEIQQLGDGSFVDSPEDQVPALLYAQHWAQSDGQPDTAVRECIMGRYDPKTLSGIDLALRVIRIGNLLGNTWDGLLGRLRFSHRTGRSVSPSETTE